MPCSSSRRHSLDQELNGSSLLRVRRSLLGEAILLFVVVRLVFREQGCFWFLVLLLIGIAAAHGGTLQVKAAVCLSCEAMLLSKLCPGTEDQVRQASTSGTVP